MTALLLVFHRQTALFVLLYLLCGLSDVLDGYVARKYGTASTMGARIDSAADLFWFVSITAILILQLGEKLLPYWPLLASALLLRILAALFAAIKYRTFMFLHTWGNKLTGILVFAVIPLYMLWHNGILVIIVCSISILSALEEGLIHIIAGEPDPDKRSIFHAGSRARFRPPQ
jgi:CDP-diacylglycerol--glycerol-3-phosphate 3-phosphatidyltransferase